MSEQQPVDDALLGKFLSGETDPAESALVRQWLIGRNAGISEPTYDDYVQFDRIWKAAQYQAKLSEYETLSTLELKRWKVERSSQLRQLLYPMAAVLMLVVSLSWLLYQFYYLGRDNPAMHVVTLVTSNQQLRKTLPDGTRILLNRHSVLTYPTDFSNDHRNFTLIGEAFFEVPPNRNNTFQIEARNTLVNAAGASFQIRAYDNNVHVAVQTGKVWFSRGRTVVLLTSNQQAMFDANENRLRRSAL